MAREQGTTKQLKVHHFMGVALGGGKTDKTALAVVEYYPQYKKIFLARLFDRISSHGETSSDLELHRIITQYPATVESLAFDVPLRLPKCLRCRLKCPGYEACSEPEIVWMWNYYREKNKQRKPKKLFTPYTERCVDLYLSTEFEESFQAPHALGSNLAPLTARAHFITRRLQLPIVEVYTKLSLWRIGCAVHAQRSHLRFHKHSVSGEESRQVILDKLVEQGLAFIYEQDQRKLIQDSMAFDAFICALTGVLNHLGLCEKRPKGFPKMENWVAVPVENLGSIW